MSESISVNVTGAGDHVLVPGQPRTWITLSRVLLTVSVPSNGTIGITGKADSNTRLGPFYMQNGGVLTFSRETIPLMRCEPGEALVVNLNAAGTLGGTLIIDRGQV